MGTPDSFLGTETPTVVDGKSYIVKREKLANGGDKVTLTPTEEAQEAHEVQ